MHIPVYVITGFIESGKTSFINLLLNKAEYKSKRVVVIQFEHGEACFLSKNDNIYVIGFSKKHLEQDINKVSVDIFDYLSSNKADEIWIEWNGVLPFSELHKILLAPALAHIVRIKKVIHIADAATIENFFGKTGAALPEQIANADFAVVRNFKTKPVFLRIKRTMQSINPGLKVYKENKAPYLHKTYKNNLRIVDYFCMCICILLLGYLSLKYMGVLSQTFIDTVINIFLGIILQALPFLLIGVLLSSIIQVFIPQNFIENKFPKKLFPGMVAAILAGFCLPVCDCASIPVFRSLVKKGIPVPIALTFMAATPIINPVVMLSTYYAFGGSLRIMLGRVLLGILTAVLIGLAFKILPSSGNILIGGMDTVMCSCGCYEGMNNRAGIKSKLDVFLRHSEYEFFNVGKFLLIGAFVSSVFQVVGTKAFIAQSGMGYLFSVVLMMSLAFLLSMCSSSDAVVARSFASQFSLGSVMGFMVFGPMLDIKNTIMLSAGFSKKFIFKLILIGFIICLLVNLLFARLLVGG